MHISPLASRPVIAYGRGIRGITDSKSTVREIDSKIEGVGFFVLSFFVFVLAYIILFFDDVLRAQMPACVYLFFAKPCLQEYQVLYHT